MLTPSTFLASAASMHTLQQSILPPPYISATDDDKDEAENAWIKLSTTIIPEVFIQHIQKTWDATVAKSAMNTLLPAARTDIDKV